MNCSTGEVRKVLFTNIYKQNIKITSTTNKIKFIYILPCYCTNFQLTAKSETQNAQQKATWGVGVGIKNLR